MGWGAVVIGIALAASASAAPPSDDPPGTVDKASPVRVSVAAAVAPGSDSFDGIVAVTYEIAAGWHIYWRHHGESGAPTTIALTLPEGVEALPIVWPAPSRHVAPGDVLDYVYTDSATLHVPVRVRTGVEPGAPLSIGVRTEWFMCTDETCVPGSLEQTVEVSRDPARAAALIDAARLAGPRAPEPEGLSYGWKKNSLALRVPGAAALTFFEDRMSATMPAVVNPLRDGDAEGDALKIEFAPNASENGRVVTGALVVERKSGERELYEVRIPGPGRAADASPKRQ